MQKRIILKDGRKVLLVGTAHVSAESVEEVRNVLALESFQAVCVELDASRKTALEKPEDWWQDLDIMSLIRRGQLGMLLAHALLSSFQRKLVEGSPVKLGEDMKTAVLWAQEQSVPLFLIDRDIKITLLRVWRKSSLWQKAKLLACLLSTALFSREKVSRESVENLKQEDTLAEAIQELAHNWPELKTVLIDERDVYLASSLWLIPHEKIVAVLGAGHLAGVWQYLQDNESEAGAKETVTRLQLVPPLSLFSKFLPWVLTLLFTGLLIWSFYRGGSSLGWQGIGYWVGINGFFSAMGAVLSGAYPVTWVVAMVGAPFTSLTPLVGIGMLTAFCEAYFRKPRVKDFMTLSGDLSSLKGFWHNRVGRILLVFIMTSLGSSLGTFLGLGFLVRLGTS